jgi:hypothetical protein
MLNVEEAGNAFPRFSMTDIRHYQLAQFSDLAFLDAPGPLPGGFAPLTAAELGIAIDEPGEGFDNGIYRNANAQALVASGTLGGQETIVIAFRGADERTDSITSLQNPNAAYPGFEELVAAVDALAAQPGGVTQVAVTGHSLGGSLTQLFMVNHPAVAGGEVHYFASTTGSPGALIPDGPDARLTNHVVADDPAVLLGENRAAVGDALSGNSLLAEQAADVAAGLFPGLTRQDALDSIPAFTENYENRGETVFLPGKTGGTGQADAVVGVATGDPGQHDISLYIQEMGQLVNRAPGAGALPLFDAGFYLRQNADVAAAGVDAQQHYEAFGWREGRDPNAAFDAAFYLGANPDVAAAGIDPLLHYETFGWREGRDPDAVFDSSAYLGTNTDVAAAGMEPLLHYLLYGWSEGRDPGPGFDTTGYLASNPDVAEAGMNPLLHYMEYGINEGRLIA